jgi:osmotically-inducible protein OsmY
MKEDSDLRRDVEAELEWDPRVDAREIGVAVKHGIVTLTGHVASYAARWAAESAVGKLAGLKAIANDIEVQLGKEGERSDTELAEAGLHALRANVSVPMRDLKMVVRDGWVTLEGTVDAGYQREIAENCVSHLHGVRGVTNMLAVKPFTTVSDVKTKIEAAFRRHAQIDAQKIHISTTNGTVMLSGEVPSWQERREAESAAWAAPGVTRVENTIAVRP